MPHPIEKWFSGKGLGIVQSYVLPTLAEAETLGYWPKGASRKVRAALSKCNLAINWARKQESRDWRNPRFPHDTADHAALGDMSCGSFGRAPKYLASKLALPEMNQWVSDFAPVADLVRRLDSRRPPPVPRFHRTLSATQLGNVGKAMGVDLGRIEFPEIVRTWVKVTLKDGREVEIAEIEIKWPEGTRHGCSRFAYGTAHNCQCHACGHAIRNMSNWVPLIGYTAEGPVSLWVGSDCAQSLFGCKIDGEGSWTKAKEATEKVKR